MDLRVLGIRRPPGATPTASALGHRMRAGDAHAARVLGTLGGRLSGPGRMKRLTPRHRRAIAADGGMARARLLSPARLREIAMSGVEARRRKREAGR